MLDNITLKDLLDLGMSGILIVFLFALWQRLNYVTDFLIQDRLDAKAERQAIAKQAGLSTQDLSREAKIARRRLDDESTL